MIICDGCGKLFNDELFTCPYCSEMSLERSVRGPTPVRGQTKDLIVMDDMSFEDNMFSDADILLEEDFH